ncbi:EEF1A lysine methyltransferase 2-like [Telopea speciosissima]|uniref:EEF1A lysine methyltransferase 2-like n=1 Tax=Telopea speciosissima TaxID=54955 RepID=UPI001CC35E25|nr:EEF1A lysine methyltransferase 2-like [Telopea speciosissima]
MAGIRWPPEDAEISHARVPTTADLISDDDRSVAADSWSIKSDYGSTLDDEQRHVDASDALSSGTFRAASDYSSDKEAPDAEVEPSMLGLQSYWDATYADELANFHEHGHTGEIWFGVEVMDIVASWTKTLCADIAQGRVNNLVDDVGSQSAEQGATDLSGWSVLDVGTGNGLLLQELAKQGFSDLTGTDYIEGAIDLARSLADRDGFTNMNFLVDDVLETKLERQFRLVMDKGTLDAIGLHPDGTIKRMMYWDSVSRLVEPGGILVITSCNNTKDELVQEVENFNQRRRTASQDQDACRDVIFRYISHVRSYPTFMFGGSEGSRVATVAFLRS